MKFTIDGETRTVEPGEAFLIPAHVPHRAEAVDGPCVALDIFSPIREDYVELANRYIPPEDKTVIFSIHGSFILSFFFFALLRSVRYF